MAPGPVPQAWWQPLGLGPDAARRVAGRAAWSPAELAGTVRAAPAAIRREFGPHALDELGRAVTAYLAANAGADPGFGELRDALDELAGRRPPKPPPESPPVGLGVVLPPPGQDRPPPPQPPLPRLGPPGRRAVPAPKPSPDKGPE